MTCCANLANSISLSQLRELDLGNNNLTDEGIKRLSGGLKSSKLETLRLIFDMFLSDKSFLFTDAKQVVYFFIFPVVKTEELQPNRAQLRRPGLSYQLSLLPPESVGPL